MNLSKRVDPVRSYVIGAGISALILLSPVIALLALIAAEALVDVLIAVGPSTDCAIGIGAVGLVLFRRSSRRALDLQTDAVG
jgi:hypothetical protein